MEHFCKTIEKMTDKHNATVVRNLNLYVMTNDTMVAAYTCGDNTYYMTVDEEMAMAIDSLKCHGIEGVGSIPDAVATYLITYGEMMATRHFDRAVADLSNEGKIR